MQYSQEHLKTMVYAKFGGQTECIMGNWKIENKVNEKGAEGRSKKKIYFKPSGQKMFKYLRPTFLK